VLVSHIPVAEPPAAETCDPSVAHAESPAEAHVTVGTFPVVAPKSIENFCAVNENVLSRMFVEMIPHAETSKAAQTAPTDSDPRERFLNKSLFEEEAEIVVLVVCDEESELL
jgi:hypothetical protein